MNLNTATNEQLEEYRQKTASILKIDPFMLDYIWMNDSETGLKNRVLYAKRGAAEVLRQNLKISILSMVPYESNGWLMFTATGQDGTGRQEIAHGSAYVDGLKADKKAHSVMTASTRALRRLTLQFVAGGVLDETEVQAQSALQGPVAASNAALAGSPAVMPPPQMAPSTMPGKDITPLPSQNETPLVNQSENIAKVYAEGAAALAAMSVPKAVIPEYFDAQNPPKEGDSLQTIADVDPKCQVYVQENLTEPRKKRQYRRKNQVDIASPGQQTEMPVGQIDATGKIIPISPEPVVSTVVEMTVQPEKVALPLAQPISVAPPQSLEKQALTTEEPVKPVIPVLSKEKQDEYRTRLSKYYNDVLPRGGMQSSEGIGGPTMKTRRFAAIHTGVADTKQMTEDHWEDLFEFLDANAVNPKFLVDYINKALGVA